MASRFSWRLVILFALLETAASQQRTLRSFWPWKSRAHNFGAGPAALPEAVLRRAQAELLDYSGSGYSVLEWTNLDAQSGQHPGVAASGQKLQEMFIATEQKLRNTLDIPSDYAVLFMHGGAVGQFSAVPMNLLGAAGAKADYIDMGFWSRRAMGEASKYGDVKNLTAFVGDGPAPWAAWERAARPDATYVHITLSETVQGVELHTDPPASWAGPPVVLDATSTILSRPLDVGRYGLIYASGGKNIPTGLAVVIIRRSFLAATSALPITPQIFEYRTNAGALSPPSIFESKPNTPPTFAVYLLGLILDHVKEEGGLHSIAQRVQARAVKLYETAASAGGGHFYRNGVHADARSRMNAVFTLPTRELERKFVAAAEKSGLHHLYGHPVSGGIRVTMYNWVRDESVAAVAKFMRKFAESHAAPKSEL